jgi:hypothetical protein
MSSVNPGVSAAGGAAGRAALDPSSGRAAIGGMLQVGEIPEDTETPDPDTLQSRLSSVVSQIAKLADAMEALRLRAADQRSGLRVDIGEADDREKSSADTAA